MLIKWKNRRLGPTIVYFVYITIARISWLASWDAAAMNSKWATQLWLRTWKFKSNFSVCWHVNFFVNFLSRMSIPFYLPLLCQFLIGQKHLFKILKLPVYQAAFRIQRSINFSINFSYSRFCKQRVLFPFKAFLPADALTTSSNCRHRSIHSIGREI